jgi:hypothetical protein
MCPKNDLVPLMSLGSEGDDAGEGGCLEDADRILIKSSASSASTTSGVVAVGLVLLQVDDGCLDCGVDLVGVT